MSRGPPGSVPRSGNRPTHPGVVFASMGCCQPREKMEDKVRCRRPPLPFAVAFLPR